MPQQTKGLFTQMLEENQRSADCARNAITKTRYQLFKEIFFGSFRQVFKINLLMALFFLPLVVVLVISVFKAESQSLLYPFGANLGIGYPAMPDLQGVSERLAVQNGIYTCVGVALASIVASVGLAGGMYAIRNMIWTEGVFVIKDFWRGVKLNYKNALQTALFFTTILLLCITTINVVDFNIAMGASGADKVFFKIAQVASYIFLALASLMTLWMIALGVNYNSSFLVLLKNSFLLTFGTFFQTVFFGVVALLPFGLFLLGDFNQTVASFGFTAAIFFSFAYALLVWLSFAQWVFDQYVNPKTQRAPQNKEDKTIYNQAGTPQMTGDDSASVLAYQRAILETGKSRLMSQPIQPLDDGVEVYELPKTFTREDLKKLKENKAALASAAETYAMEHKDEARYVEYIERFEARERSLQEQENKNNQKGKKKKK